MLGHVYGVGLPEFLPEFKGVQRLMMQLIEGRHQPTEVLAQEPSRCYFETRCAFPKDLPYRSLSLGLADSPSPPPSVVVFLMDPRLVAMAWWRSMQTKFGIEVPLADLISSLVRGEDTLLRDTFGSALAWVNEARTDPEHVFFCRADVLWAADSKKARIELLRLMEFLEIPGASAEELCKTLQCSTLRGSSEVSAETATHSLELFQEALGGLEWKVLKTWQELLDSWVHSEHPHLVLLALTVTKKREDMETYLGLKVLSAHQAGLCRPCVFAPKGTCRNGEAECKFCHEKHPKKQSYTRRKFAQGQTKLDSRAESQSWEGQCYSF